MTSAPGGSSASKRKYQGDDVVTKVPTKGNEEPDSLNNKTYSDVTVKFGDQQVFAHKVYLAKKSVYFHRAFQSLFSVARGKIVDLGNDDNPELVHNMLRYIYDLPYENMAKRVEEEKRFDFHIDMFLMGDKYDVQSLRRKAADQWRADALTRLHTERFALAVQRICGPSAVQCADDRLQQTALACCKALFAPLSQNSHYVKLLKEGTLLDARFAGALAADLTVRLKVLDDEKNTLYRQQSRSKENGKQD